VERDVNDGQLAATDLMCGGSPALRETDQARSPAAVSHQTQSGGLLAWLQSDQALIAALALVMALFARCLYALHAE